MSARDMRLVALHEINQAHAHLGNACMRLQKLQNQLKRAGVQVEVLDLALADASSADEYARAARLVLWSAFTDEQKTRCA